MVTYKFDQNRLMIHLLAKFKTIKAHLAKTYVENNSEKIMQRAKNKKNYTLIRQEDKEKQSPEDADIKIESSVLEPAQYEVQFEQQAVGFVTDELS